MSLMIPEESLPQWARLSYGIRFSRPRKMKLNVTQNTCHSSDPRTIPAVSSPSDHPSTDLTESHFFTVWSCLILHSCHFHFYWVQRRRRRGSAFKQQLHTKKRPRITSARSSALSGNTWSTSVWRHASPSTKKENMYCKNIEPYSITE